MNTPFQKAYAESGQADYFALPALLCYCPQHATPRKTAKKTCVWLLWGNFSETNHFLGPWQSRWRGTSDKGWCFRAFLSHSGLVKLLLPWDRHIFSPDTAIFSVHSFLISFLSSFYSLFIRTAPRFLFFISASLLSPTSDVPPPFAKLMSSAFI